MANIDDMVAEVADLLNDNEDGCAYVRWSKSSIKHWLLEGYSFACNVATHKNTDLVEIELKEGSVQKLPEGYEQFVRVVNNPGTNELISDATEKKAKDRYRNIGAASLDDCKTTSSGSTLGSESSVDADYQIKTWEGEPMSSSLFYVNPPVPKGYTGKVKVLAIKIVDISSDMTQVPVWAHAMAIDWALHRAYATESESQYSMEKSKMHRDNYYQLLSLFKPPQQMNRSSSMSTQQ